MVFAGFGTKCLNFFFCFGIGYLLFSMYILLGFGLSACSELLHAFNIPFLRLSIYKYVLSACCGEALQALGIARE